jgi:hypothetical protein
MKLQLLSDLHLEQDPELRLAPALGADLLVLAGDIGCYQSGSLLGGDDFGLARFSPRHGWPVPVLYLPGNHEYDGLEYDATYARLRALCADLGIHWLERETRVIGGVRFVGTTLWADLDALAAPGDPMGVVLDKRTQAMRVGDRYLRTTGTTRAGAPWLSAAVREESLACQQWLRAALAQPFDGPTVAVTHFAPSLASADPRFGLTPGTANFCNALDDLLPQAQLWLHGHLHCPSDYVRGGCRVVANPRGYAAQGEQAGFRPDWLIEVPSR